MANSRKMIARKVFNSFITILLVITMNFFLFRVMPGDPLMNLRANTRLSDEFKQKMIEDFGLDQSLPIQFLHYLKNVFTLDFGNSYIKTLTPAMDIILGNLTYTLILTGVSSLLMIAIGMLIGVISAWKRGSKFDTGSLAFSLFFYAMPTFWLAMMLVVIFAIELNWFPSSGALEIGADLELLKWTGFKDVVYHLVLPATSLTLGSIAAFSLIMRGSLIDVMTEDYITTARAKGLKDFQVLRSHAVPNAMLPMVALIAIDLAFVVGGAFQTEVVFDYPGIGWLTVEATFDLDYAILEGAFFIIALVVIVANLLADILLVYMDPRIKEG
jgi:peptide/nickel transport system permease protein